MAVSLRTRLVMSVVLLCFLTTAVISLTMFFSFRQLIFQHFRSELSEEAADFAALVTHTGDSIQIVDGPEWNEPEHRFDSDHARYILVADSEFKTVRQSYNLGERDLRTLFDLSPVAEPEMAEPVTDSLQMICLVSPLYDQAGLRYGYVLSAASLMQSATLTSVMESIVLTSLLIALAGGGVMAVFLARRVTRPLVAIETLTSGMDLASLDQRITVKSKETEIKNLTKSLNQLFERLQRSVRQINDFSSNVSHELRTPLTILRGNIEVGLSKNRTEDEYVLILSDLLEETMHVIKIIDDMLLLARADNRALLFKRETIDLHLFCEEYRRDWEIYCSARKQKLVCSVERDLCIVGDKTMMYQMALNLISNASKYSPEKGLIEVIVAGNESGQGSEVEFTFRDQGQGIPGEYIDRVFERFYRVGSDRSRDSGGIGLGLPIAKMIVEMHGGVIHLESTPGKGTTVRIRMPARNNEA